MALTKEQSIRITSEIGKYIAEFAPVVEYGDKDLTKAFAEFTADSLKNLQHLGLYDGDFEKFYVIRKFLTDISLSDGADGEYIAKIFANAEKLSVDRFTENSYISSIKIPDVQIGDMFLTNAVYEKGEILLRDMPDFAGKTVVPKLGFFDSRVTFPTIYEKNIPRMSVCPSEINSMKKKIRQSHGNVLVLGLGLGYYPHMISSFGKVGRITVVEINPTVIHIFGKYILPQFKYGHKIEIIQADAIEYLRNVKNGKYDFCFANIWNSVADGAVFYEKIKPFEEKLPLTQFEYRIEDEIKYFIANIQ